MPTSRPRKRSSRTQRRLDRETAIAMDQFAEIVQAGRADPVVNLGIVTALQLRYGPLDEVAR